MSPSEFRLEMDKFWESVEQEGRQFKDSYIALERLRDLYQSFDEAERAMADQVIGAWLLSEYEAKRFDALVLVEEFRIASSLPRLRELASRLESSSEPGAPFELEKVSRKIQLLSGTNS